MMAFVLTAARGNSLPRRDAGIVRSHGALILTLAAAFVACLGCARAEASQRQSDGAAATPTAMAISLTSQGLGGTAPDALERIALGNTAYRDGRFADAWQSYLDVLNSGMVSSGLYYNMGNTAYRLGQRSLALAAFRLAQDRAPRDREVAANIAFVRSGLTGRDALPRDRTRDLLDWVGLLNEREYLFLTSSLITIFFLGLALRALVGGRAGARYRGSQAFTIGVGTLCPLVAGAGLWVHTSTAPGARCITLDRGVVMRSEASASSLSLLEIPAVAELTVLDQLPPQSPPAGGAETAPLAAGSDKPRTGGWVRVRLGDGLSGWVPSDDVIVF